MKSTSPAAQPRRRQLCLTLAALVAGAAIASSSAQAPSREASMRAAQTLRIYSSLPLHADSLHGGPQARDA